jgi:hypothetical protein
MSTWPRVRALFWILASANAAGCVGSGATSTELHGSGPDAGDGGAPEAGARGALPLVDYLGGPIVAAPKVVTITYGADNDPAADPLRAFLEGFDDAIMTTAWWDAVTAGYCDGETPPKCVGHGSSGGHVHLTDLPAAAYDDGPAGGTLRTLLQGYLTSGVLPAPDPDTIYVLFLQASTMVTVDGSFVSCREFGAYHASFEATLPGGGTATVPYVVVPRCTAIQQSLTMSVSHELIETAVDPVDPDPALGGNGYSMTTDTAWPKVGGGSEVADLCEWTNGDKVQTMEGSDVVTRSWSNLAAAAGHDPCVPAPDPATSPYFNVAPAKDALTLAVGESTTLDLDAFSDGPTADWTVSIADVSQRIGGTPMAVQATLDGSVANAGTRLHLTIMLNSAAPPTKPALLLLTSLKPATSRLGGPTVHRWPIAVTSR